MQGLGGSAACLSTKGTATDQGTSHCPPPFSTSSLSPRCWLTFPNKQTGRLSGWWGHNPATRFQMPPEFDPSKGAAGFKISNPDVLSTVSLLGSLEIFVDAMDGEGMSKLRAKSELLTGYLESLLVNCGYYVPPDAIDSFEDDDGAARFTIITPTDVAQRGAQLSILILPRGKRLMETVFQALVDQGIVGDERQPDVIRLAPTPLYNTFEEVRRTALALMDILQFESQLLQDSIDAPAESTS
jgi:kynureninase